jgi:hypothetical protein
MGVGAIVGTVFVVLLAAGSVVVVRHRPSPADERRALEESRVHGELELTDIQRRPGVFGGH